VAVSVRLMPKDAGAQANLLNGPALDNAFNQSLLASCGVAEIALDGVVVTRTFLSAQ